MSKGGVLLITAIEGKALAPKDSNGKSDPYVKIIMLGCKLKKGQEQKTKPIDKTLDPAWNHKFNPVPYDNEETSAVHVILFDKDTVGSDDFMGQIMIPVYEVKNAGGKLDKWYQLVTNESGENVSGSIHLSFEMSSDEELEKKKNWGAKENRRGKTKKDRGRDQKKNGRARETVEIIKRKEKGVWGTKKSQIESNQPTKTDF